MAIGYRPVVKITGKHEAIVNERLIDWEHIDAAGIESDRLHLTVDTRGLDGLPQRGAEIGLTVGYEDAGELVDKGKFTISRVTPKLWPHQLLIVATAAPWRQDDPTQFRLRRSESYADTTLGELFRLLVRKHGFSPRVAPTLDAIPIEHVDQTDETDMGFLTRLASRYDAVTKPYNGLYVLARRGQVKSISGRALPAVTLSVPADNKPGEQAFTRATMDDNARVRFRGCRSTWWDGEAGKECVVEVGEDAFKRLRQRYQNEAEAKLAAEGELRKLDRERTRIRIECPGNPLLAAEGIVTLDDTWPAYVRGTYSIDKLRSSGSRRMGYRCEIEATWPEGRETADE
ncbi:MAG: contractile injection system protein, VgrG/Pvc8 family [Pseudomonadota bacterium]|nr:contractile injection system protein, VgrG/Pvc8 family [Pseudomonadota bacterium]